MIVLLFFLAQFGFAYIVGHSAISAPVREHLGPYYEDPATLERGALNKLRLFFTKLVECPACLGFWTGGLFGRTLFDVAGAPTFFGGVMPPLGLFLFYGCATAGSNFILGRLTRLM